MLTRIGNYIGHCRLFAQYSNRNHSDYYLIELSFSVLHFINGNPRWFCRIWKKDWLQTRTGRYYGYSYGITKYQAYRNALKQLHAN